MSHAAELGRQIDWIKQAQAVGGRQVGVWPDAWQRSRRFDFLYRPERLLVLEPDVGRVAPRVPGFRTIGSAGRGVVEAEAADHADLPTILEQLVGEFGPVVSPVHYAHVSPAGFCPADDPQEYDGQRKPWPLAMGGGDGHGVRVGIIDTGLLHHQEANTWIDGVKGDWDNPDEVPNDGYIDYYAGHGTFCAGVVRAMAPKARVQVEDVLHLGGVADEAEIGRQVHQALDREPAIISMSAGMTTLGGRGSLVFERVRERVEEQDVLVVAAAGNDDSADESFWPAAFDWVRGVGATDEAGTTRAPFSNYGDWVDVYAPGVNHINAYAHGPYKPMAHPDELRHFHGIAKWSGTSFSTPLVAGLVARRMSHTGESAHEAYEALVSEAHHRIEDKPVLMP